MRKFAWVSAIVVLIALAFAGGYILRLWQSAPHTPGTAQALFGAVKAPKPKAPPEWTEWRYPGSTEQGSSKGGGGTMNGLTVGPIDSVILTTPDDFEKVLEWYANKFDSPVIAVPTGSGSLGKFNTENTDDPIINANVMLASNRPGDERDKGTWRPVRMKVISARTPRYDLVINVSRAEGESHTHVVVTYFPNKPGE
jgi:hypothetical protein